MSRDADNPRDWTATLIGLLERQQTLVTELAGLARSQSELIETRRTDALLGLLSRRQRLIDAFSASQEELGQITGNLDAQVGDLEPAERTRIQTLIAAIGEQLTDVMQCDGNDQQMLERVRGETARELSGVDAARTARNAYRDRGAPGSRFADRTG